MPFSQDGLMLIMQDSSECGSDLPACGRTAVVLFALTFDEAGHVIRLAEPCEVHMRPVMGDTLGERQKPDASVRIIADFA